MKTPSLKKNIALNLFKTLLSLLFPLITFPYSSRVLLPDGIGKVNFARAIIEYFVLIATLGIHVYGVREAAKVRDDKYKLSKFSKEVFTINMISTAVAYILFFIALFCVPKFSSYRILLCVISSTILFKALGLEWLYGAVEDYKYITIRYIIFHIITLILLFVLVHEPKDYLWYAMLSVVSNVGANVLNFVHSRKYISFSMVKSLDFRRHLKPIFTLFAMAAVIKVYAALDKAMLGFICNDWEVGIYTAAVKINKVVLSLVVAACTVLLPRLSFYSEKNEIKKFNNLAYKGFNVLLLVSIPSCVGLSLVSYHVTMLLSGIKYAAAVSVMRVMNPIIVIIGISNFVGMQLFMPLRKEKFTLCSVAFGAVVNFSMNLVLIPKYHSMGAAISTLCAESMVTAVQLFLAKDMIDLNKVFKPFMLYLFDAAIMSIPVFLIINNVKSLFFGFAFGVFTGIIVYGLLLLFQKNELVYAGIDLIKKKIK